jgi:hypothetical protein
MDTNLVSKNLNWDVFENRQKKSLKKILIFFFFFNLKLFYFFILLKVLKVRRPVRKTSGFRTVWILKICRTSGPDVMSGRALVDWPFLVLKFTFFLKTSSICLKKSTV